MGNCQMMMRFPVGCSLLLLATVAFDNSCLTNDANLVPPTPDAPTTFLSECPAWVLSTTDAVWNLPESRDPVLRNASLEEYFYSNWTSHSSWGSSKHGMQALKDLVAGTLVAFPDLQIHVTDVFCHGNDIDGYKTVMPDVLIGTNTGPSSYGPATGRRVEYSGTAVTYVQRVNGRWVYVAEWLLHDEWSLIDQLGFSDLTKVPHPALAVAAHDCRANQPGFGWHPPGHLQAASSADLLVQAAPPSVHEPDPTAKATIRQMDRIISQHLQWNNWSAWSALQKPFWTTNFVYDTVYTPSPGVLGNSTTLRQWYDHEHIPFNLAFTNVVFNQMIFAGDDGTATTNTYATALFSNNFATVPHTGTMIHIRICDFYRMDGDRISYNWMMLDMVGIMLQAGHRVLPEPPLRELWIQPPKTMDGIPAPLSAVVQPRDSIDAKKLVAEVLQSEWLDQNSSGAFWAKDMVWYGPVGFGVANGVEEYLSYFLKPLHAAFDRCEMQVDVLCCEGKFCGAHGYLHAVHTGGWLGQAATGKRVALRFGMHWHVDLVRRRVVEGYAMFNLPAVFKQMGVDLYGRMNQTVGL